MLILLTTCLQLRLLVMKEASSVELSGYVTSLEAQINRLGLMPDLVAPGMIGSKVGPLHAVDPVSVFPPLGATC